MLVRILTGLVEQNDLIDVAGLEFAQLLADRIGGADETTSQRLLDDIGVGILPCLEFGPNVDCASAGALARRAHTIEPQRELEEGQPLGPAPGFFVGLGAHEVGDERDVGIDLVVAELVEAFGASSTFSVGCSGYLNGRSVA